MSNGRAIFWLVVLCLSALGANLAVAWYRPGAKPLVRGVPIDLAFEPTRIIIERRGVKPTVLAKTDVWRLVEPYAASVDAQVVLRLTDAILFCTPEDSITDAELLRLGRTRADFRLEDPTLRVTLKDGSEELSFAFGDATPSSNGVYSAVSRFDAVLVLPASVRRAADLQASAFRQRGVFEYGPESVRSFDLKRPAGTLLGFTRVGDSWQVGDTPASAKKVGDFLSLVSNAKALDFIWPIGVTNEAENASASLLSGYGLDPESAVTVVLRCVDGVDRRVSLGGPADEGRVYALVQNGLAVVTLESSLRDMAMQDAALFTDSRLFPYEADAVKSYTLTDGETDYVVARTTDGSWWLEAPVVAAADPAAASAILQQILTLTASDVTTEGIKVSVTTNASPVFVPMSHVLADRRLEDLRSKEVLKIDPAHVKRLVSTPGKGKSVAVVYSRERRGWNVASADTQGQTSIAGIDMVLGAINPLRASRIVALKASASDLAKYGLDEPHFTVAVDPGAEGAVRRNILIGGNAPAGRYATIGSAESVFILPHATVKQLTAKLVEE